MKEIIIAVTIVLCFAIASLAVVARVRVVMAYKTAKLTIGANEVLAKLHNLSNPYRRESVPPLNGRFPSRTEEDFFKMGYQKGFEEARNQMIGVAMSAKIEENEDE